MSVAVQTTGNFKPLHHFARYIPKCTLRHAPHFLSFRVSDATVMLFASGQMIVTGIPHPTHVNATVNNVLDTISNITHHPVSAINIRIKTILATAKLARMVCPYKSTIHSHTYRSYYEPEMCNAIVFVAQTYPSPVTIKVFPRTGSVIAFGKSLSDMNAFYSCIRTDICSNNG